MMMASSVAAAPIFYSASGAGAAGAAATFQTSAALLGAVETIDFESASLPTGVALGGVSNVALNPTATGAIGSPTGYPIGGTQFLQVAKPANGSAGFSFQFAFDPPANTGVQAWGAYLTGLTSASNVHLSIDFNDGSTQTPGDLIGSNSDPLFIGFTDAGANIASISFVMSGQAETFGVDNVQFVRAGDITGQAVPEPSTFALLGVGAVGLLRRRRRAA
jgi:hypothetical protein